MSTGCQKRRFRSIPKAADRFLSIPVDEYESEEAKDRFAAEKFATQKQINLFLGGLEPEDHARFSHDPRLDAVAYVYAQAYAKTESRPAKSLTNWVMWKMGITGDARAVSYWAQYRHPIKTLNKFLTTMASKMEPDMCCAFDAV